MCLLIGLSAVSLFMSIHRYAYKHAMVNADMIISHAFNYDNSWMENDGEESSTTYLILYTSADQDYVSQSTNRYVAAV